ncbi:MAG: DMT family transporter, partial [Halanaerobiales bacterium]
MLPLTIVKRVLREGGGSILGHSPLFLLVAVAAGLIMAVQGSINSALGKNIGLWETTFLVHLTAAVILVGVLATISSNIDRNIFSRIPWYLYLGGVLGVLIT